MSSPSSESVPPVSSTIYRPPMYANTLPRVTLKTSASHPISISWIVPEELVPAIAAGAVPPTVDLFDIYTSASLYKQYNENVKGGALDANTSRDTSSVTDQQRYTRHGNLALSSCPGKKVRLGGPVGGRATIDRDLDLDFQRLRSLDISAIICCLNDEELEYLGAPWSQYQELAKHHGLHIIRIPMIEGGCPNSLEQIDDVVKQMDAHMEQDRKVLAHCRGGVGRAGLVACCWLLKRQLCFTGERAIQLVRMRRSPKAIETVQQVEFILKYANYIQWNLEQQKEESETQQLGSQAAVETSSHLNTVAASAQ